MEFKEFEIAVVEAIQNKYGEEYRVMVHQVTKNNGVVLSGMSITRQDKNISPTIYLEPYFEQFQDGMAWEDILEDICDLYEMNQENTVTLLKELNDFEGLKDKIAYKLIGRDKNELLLNDVPHRPFLDLAIVYYLLLESNENGQMTALIHNEHLKLWNVGQEELHQLAEENTGRLHPVSIRPIKDIMVDMVLKNVDDSEEAEMICEYMSEDDVENGHPLFVLSNVSGIYGAVSMLYDGVMEQFARERKQNNIIILPSSVHEVLLLGRSDGMEYEELQQMVRNVNGTMISGEDILSEHVYVYKCSDNKIHLAI